GGGGGNARGSGGSRERGVCAVVDRAADPGEGFLKEGRDVMRLQSAGRCPFHFLPDRLDTQRVERSAGKSAFFEQLLQVLPIERAFDYLRQAGTHFRPVAVAHGLDQQLAEWSILKGHSPQHVEDLSAEGGSLFVKFLQ